MIRNLTLEKIEWKDLDWKEGGFVNQKGERVNPIPLGPGHSRTRFMSNIHEEIPYMAEVLLEELQKEDKAYHLANAYSSVLSTIIEDNENPARWHREALFNFYKI